MEQHEFILTTAIVMLMAHCANTTHPNSILGIQSYVHFQLQFIFLLTLIN